MPRAKKYFLLSGIQSLGCVGYLDLETGFLNKVWFSVTKYSSETRFIF